MMLVSFYCRQCQISDLSLRLGRTFHCPSLRSYLCLTFSYFAPALNTSAYNLLFFAFVISLFSFVSIFICLLYLHYLHFAVDVDDFWSFRIQLIFSYFQFAVCLSAHLATLATIISLNVCRPCVCPSVRPSVLDSRHGPCVVWIQQVMTAIGPSTRMPIRNIWRRL